MLQINKAIGRTISIFLYEVCSRFNISISRVIITKWLSFRCEIEKILNDIGDECELSVRLAGPNDIAFLERLVSMEGIGNHVLAQDLRFWNDYGFRSLYVGDFRDESEPSVFCYLISDSEKDILYNMDYGDLYRGINKSACQSEGIFVLNDHRGLNLANKMRLQLMQIAIRQGKNQLKEHIPVNESKIANFISLSKLGAIPEYWIFRVTLDFPFFRNGKGYFIKKNIKDNDWSKFPLIYFKS